MRVDCKVGAGKAKYLAGENVVVWKSVHLAFPSTPLEGADRARRIPRLQGQSETTLTAEAILSSTTFQKAWSRPPISIDFQILMFTASGLLVRFLKVFEKGGYQSVKVSIRLLCHSPPFSRHSTAESVY